MSSAQIVASSNRKELTRALGILVNAIEWPRCFAGASPLLRLQ